MTPRTKKREKDKKAKETQANVWEYASAEKGSSKMK